MSACRGNEYSYETPGLRHGVFTYYFLQAINYPSSDSNGDGIISLEEQFAYAMPRTQSYVSGLGGSQTPQLYDGIEGYPIFGSISFTIIENILDFSFNFYGHGSISVLNITVCSLIPNVVVKSWNLLQGWGSVNGFGYNNGSVELIQGNITGFELIAMVQGNSLKTLTFSFGDSDKDGLEDLFEILEGNGTDPSLFDTDFDGLNDYEEFYGITDPTINDTDGDGMTDGYEINNDLDPINNDTTLDFDNDGLLNILEFQLGTIANNSDTDSDNIPDGWEYENGLNISFNDGNVDLDNDDLTNLMEYTYRTDPWLNDTDGDGWGDGDEILIYNTDPLDPNNFPQFNQNNNLALFIAAIVSPITIVGISLYFIRYKKKRE